VAWIDSGMTMTLTEVDLVSLARNAVEDLEPRAEVKHISLLLDAPSAVPPIMADSTRIGQVVTNLLTNAIKYSDEHTTVTLRIGAQDHAVTLTVSDQGFGISPENLPNLFQRFYRVQDRHTRRIEGSGLGLYITRSIVERHSGHITVESEPGKGSTFTVTLPLKTPEVQE
jgi:signal transduction histidine kinase